MIAPLRRAHRLTFRVLAIALPVGIFCAIDARPQLPSSPRVAGVSPSTRGSGISAPPLTDPGLASLELEDGSRLELRRAASELGVTPVGHSPSLPTLLLYLCPALPEGDALPADARLVGSLGGPDRRLFDLGEDSVRGEVLVYSLAHQRIVGHAALPEQED